METRNNPAIPAQSRAMNLSLGEPEVKKLCAAKNVAISALEPLPSGGTRLVCTVIEGADTIRAAAGKSLLDDRVKRFRFFDPHGRTSLR